MAGERGAPGGIAVGGRQVALRLEGDRVTEMGFAGDTSRWEASRRRSWVYAKALGQGARASVGDGRPS